MFTLEQARQALRKKKAERQIPKAIREAILAKLGNACVYCGGVASALDHIVPYEADPIHLESNLVPSCVLCNSIAHDHVFGSLGEKRRYILARRMERADVLESRGIRLLPRKRKTYRPPKAKPRKRVEVVEVVVPSGNEFSPGHARQALLELHQNTGMSWRQIAALGQFEGIGHSTLWRFAKLGILPRKRRDRVLLGIVRPRRRHVCPDCGGPLKPTCPVCRPPSRHRDSAVESRANEQPKVA